MSETNTPETDAMLGQPEYCVIKHARKLERERDDAREKLSEWENAAAHVEAEHADEVHCGCVPVLRKLLTDSRKLCTQMSQEREHNAMQALMWRSVAETFHRIITGMNFGDSFKPINEALKAYEEAKE